MFVQEFAVSTKQRLQKCRDLVVSCPFDRFLTGSLLKQIHLEISAIAGEAEILMMSDLAIVAAEMLDRVDAPNNPDDGSYGQALTRGLDVLEMLVKNVTSGKVKEIPIEKMLRYFDDSSAIDSKVFERATEQLGPSRRILFIDDSEITCEMIKLSLETEGHKVEVVKDLMSFDETMKKFKPQIILTDVNMPDISGDRICRVLKSEYDTRDIPIILFSSIPKERLCEIAQKSGADGYVSKQQGIEILIEQIDQLVDLVLW